MQRYFIAPTQFMDSTVLLTGDDAHHLLKVMRGRIGEQVICSNGIDREALVAVKEILPGGEVVAEIVEMLPMTSEPAIQVTIAQSLPKGDKMETVIQKGTEIGAVRFLPFTSERTIVQYDRKKEAKRLERWQKIAKEAAEQAHRNRVPVVEDTHSWAQLMEKLAHADAAFLCYEKEEGLKFKDALRHALHSSGNKPSMEILLIIGPEGGFTEEEVREAETAGCKSISLGKRILRTETAAMVGLTCILYETGEMGG